LKEHEVTITQQPTSQGDLPAHVFPVDHGLPLALSVEEGQIVAFRSRDRFRAAKVVKVTAKRVTAIYTTPGARRTAEEIASIDSVAMELNSQRRNEATAARYREMADLTERLEMTVTEGRKHPDTPFVKIASLPAEYQALEAQGGGSNVARTTIVWAPASLREWADALDSDEAVARHEVRLAAHREWMAKPLAQRIAESTHVTTKIVQRGEVFEVSL
jgi:hypothetical protein